MCKLSSIISTAERVGIATGYGMNCRGSIPDRVELYLRELSSLLCSRYRAVFLEVNWQGNLDDYTFASSAAVSKSGATSPLPTLRLYMVLNKAQDKFRRKQTT
jgi:hypothetical protein